MTHTTTDDPAGLASAITATIGVLRRSTVVGALVDGRIYGGELPPSDAQNMPRTALVVSAAGLGVGGARGGRGGSPGAYDFLGVSARRIDVKAYGADTLTADKLQAAAHHALKNWAGGVVDRHLVRPVMHVAGPVYARDPLTDWPMYVTTYHVLHGDRLID